MLNYLWWGNRGGKKLCFFHSATRTYIYMICHSPFVVVELVVEGLTRPGGRCDFATPTVGIAEGCYDSMMPSLTCVFFPPLIRSDLAARKGNNRNASASIIYIVIKT